MPQSDESESDHEPDEVIVAIRKEFAAWAKCRIDTLRRTCSLEELARRADLSDSTMDNLRNGRGSWHKLGTIQAIASALGDDPDLWEEKWSECDRSLEEAKAARDPGVAEAMYLSPEGLPPAETIGRSPGSHTPSVAKQPRRPWLMVAGAAATVALMVAAIVLIDALSDSSSGSGCLAREIDEDSTTVDEARQIFMDCVGGNPTRRELKDLVAKFRDAEPIGEGPWPFYVHVNHIGLKVRTSGDVDGQQIGTAHNATTLWVECRLRTDFTPDRGDIVEDVGPRWLRVKWPHNQPGVIEPYTSSPDDPYVGYVYEAYAFPAGHNGEIRACRQ